MKPFAAAFTLFYRNIVRYFKHFGVCALRIGKYMKLRKIQTPDKFKRLLKQFIRFAPDTHNDIHSNE